MTPRVCFCGRSRCARRANTSNPESCVRQRLKRLVASRPRESSKVHIKPRPFQSHGAGERRLCQDVQHQKTEEEVSIGGYCQSRLLSDPGASLTPQQGCTTCCQDNDSARRRGKQHRQLPAPQPPVWRVEKRLHHRSSS
ncbi:hypothetical protein Q5P01_010809 [Channa striata]|uniref:Uncharacterized protein n=1 Tax=Channa striata TaxID=64152 RepID=A0AA88SM89_CHASR|nr:hypothetical protein Q5P01_010809 [Channa striata]